MKRALKFLLLMLCRDTGATYILTEDIDFSDQEWTPSGKFFGTFDGNGHVISGLRGDGTGAALFSHLIGANVKNLTIKDVVANVGALSNRTEGATIIENVSVNIVGVSSGHGGRTSFLGYVVEEELTITIKDCVVMIMETSNGYVGYISTHAGSKVVLDQVLMIGGNGLLHSAIGNHSTYIAEFLGDDGLAAAVNEDYYVYTDVDDFAQNYQIVEVPDCLKEQYLDLIA